MPVSQAAERQDVMHPQPLDFLTPVQERPDARPIFRLGAGLLGIGAAATATFLLYFGLGQWKLLAFAAIEFAFACAALKLAITGRLQVALPADA